MSNKWEPWMASFNLPAAELSLRDDKAPAGEFGRSLVAGPDARKRAAIASAFEWKDSMQSFSWWMVEEAGHTPESWMILMDMVRRYKEYKGIDDAHNPEHQ